MQALIVSDHEPTTLAVRELLLREGIDCPAANLSSLGLAADHLTRARPDLIVVALVPDADRALAAVAQLHLLTQVPLLAVGPAADSRLVLRALRSGATDYVDAADLEAELRGVLGRLQSALPTRAEPARTIAVLAPSGGSGSSTLAANIATVLAKEHQSALLVDLKLHTGDLAALLDLKPTHTLAELCRNLASMDRIMLERSLVRHASGVHLLAPPRTFADAELVTADGVRQALNLGRMLFPYVVIDLDHSFGPEQLQALGMADLVLVVLRLDFTCLRNTQRTLDYLNRLGVPQDRVRVVVNRYGQAKEVPASKAEEALGVKVFHYVPEDAKTVNRANNSGVPIVLESPWAKVSRSLTNLAHNVNGRHA
jgi:pilus assembly protein CpaE